jgi:predicted short-subunit dehydrogenase-like oxidoreductase (DUF2520 family)
VIRRGWEAWAGCAGTCDRPIGAYVYPADVVSPPPRLRVGVIGTGRAGAVIGAALRRAGHDVVACSARGDISRVRAEALLPGVPIVAPSEVARSCDLLVLAVPDDALAGVVQSLASDVHAGQIVMHLSGRHGLGILAPLRDVIPIAAHPVMTFTGTSLDLDRLDDCPFGVTADGQGSSVAAALVMEMGGDPLEVDDDRRTLYHAALAHGANHLVTLVAQTLDLLAAAGVAEPERIARPLLTAALDNSLREGDRALTGPVARADHATVRAHIEGIHDPDVERTYRALALATVDRAHAAGTLTALDAESLRAILTEEGA